MVYYTKNTSKFSGDGGSFNESLKKKKAFTLVELIIVITILAILATIAFISMQSFMKDTRDAKRVSEIKTIENGLELYAIKESRYPLPDGDREELTGGEVVLISKGIIGNEVVRAIGLNNIPKDLKTGDFYSYGITGDRKNYQVASIQETDILSYLPFVLHTYANKILTALVKGNYTPSFLQAGEKEYFVPSLIWREKDLIESEFKIDDGVKKIDIEEIVNENDENIFNDKIFYVINDDVNTPYGDTQYKSNFELNYIQELKEELNREKLEENKYENEDFQSLFNGNFQKDKDDKSKEIYEYIGVSIGIPMLDCKGGSHNTIKSFYTFQNVPYVNEASKCPDPVEFICKNGVWKNNTGGTEIKEDYKYADCFVGTPQNCEVGVEKSGYMLGEKLNHLGETTLTKTDGNFLNGTAQLKQEFMCFNGELQEKEGEDEVLEIVSCDEGYYKDTSINICTSQWSGDGTSGNPYIFRDTNGNQQYPLSCKDLLVSTTPKFNATTKLLNGVYTIKTVGNSFNVYCDMTTDGGGWTFITNNHNGDEEPSGCYAKIANNSSLVCGTNNLAYNNDFAVLATNISFKEMIWVAYTGNYNKEALTYLKWNTSKTIPTGQSWNITADSSNEKLGGYPSLKKITCTQASVNAVFSFVESKKYAYEDKYITTFGVTGVTPPRLLSFTDAHGNNGDKSQLKGVDDYQNGDSCSDSWTPQKVRGYSSYIAIR